MPILNAKDSVILALDLDQTKAEELLQELGTSVKWLKVGMSLFYQAGPSYIINLKDRGYKVFLDLKLHDIPHQLSLSCKNLAHLGADLLTIHASGGEEMIRAAVEALEGSNTQLLCVSVLTSFDQETLLSIGVTKKLTDQVNDLTRLSMDAGAHGMVCSAQEAARIKEIVGPHKYIVTPGIRPKNNALQDQKRVMTPRLALKNGATHLVIGRPITQAKDPKLVLKEIYKDIEEIL